MAYFLLNGTFSGASCACAEQGEGLEPPERKVTVIANWFPPNVSTYGGEIDSVIQLIFYFSLFWFVLLQGALLLFAVRYRRKAGVRAAFVRGESARQVSWILVPAVLVLICDLGIDAAGGRAWETVKGSFPPPAVTVHVTASQFVWQFTYPGPDGRFGAGQDLKSDSLHVPVGKVVRLVLQSEDVIHDFFVPELRLKQDIVPGRKIPAWFEATKPGTYEIACSQLCGPAHFDMRGELVVQSEADYETWLKQARTAASKTAASSSSAKEHNS